MSELQRLVGDAARAAAEDLVHLHAYGQDLTPCGIDPWGPLDEGVYSTSRAGSVTCAACLAVLRPEANKPCTTRTPHEAHDWRGFAIPEGMPYHPPQHCPGVPDAPPLYLVWQYGEARIAFEYAESGGAEERRAEAEIDMLRARIEAEENRLRAAAVGAQQPEQASDGDGDPWFIHGCGIVLSAGMNVHESTCREGYWSPLFTLGAALPQQPVQARDEDGIPLFIHACGHVSPESTPGVAEGEHHRFPPCRTPGPWRPLLVGGDR